MTELSITDWEQDEEVATVTDDGSWDAETPLAEDVLEGMLSDGGTAYWRDVAPPSEEGGSTAEVEVPIEPGEDGYLYAVAEGLPSPLEPGEADMEGLEPPDVDPEPPDDDEDLTEKMWNDLVNLAEQKLS